jgi:hypothetical protein
MRIAGFMATHHIAEQALSWIRHAREIFDEFVIFLDENRLTPGTLERAESVATRVHRRRAKSWYDLDFGSMATACKTDWVFAFDHDEELSGDWSREALHQVLDTTDVTHFWCPRRWIVGDGTYIDSAPWWPDLQLRLLRNDLSETAFPTRLHDIIQVPGSGACLVDFAIYHHVLWLSSRADREAKVQFYEQLRPGGDLRHYYLYEDFAPPTARLPAPATSPLAARIEQMEKLPTDDICNISIELQPPPRATKRAALLLFFADVRNGSRCRVGSFPPYPVHIASHWLEASTRNIVIFEGQRSAVFPAVDAGQTARASVAVSAPDQPGEYILQITLVQEQVQWFEMVKPDVVQEFPMRVV